MKLILTVFSVLMINSVSHIAQAQVWRQYEWEYFNIKFELPDHFTVTINTAEALKASGEGIEFALYPFKDTEMKGMDLAEFIIRKAENDLNLSEINEMELVEIDGLNGGFVAGSKDGLLYMVLGLIDAETDNNFYAFVAFDAEQKEVIEDALEVFESFGKMQ